MPADLCSSSAIVDAWPEFAELPAGRQAALITSASRLAGRIVGRELGLDSHTERLRPGATRLLRLQSRPVVTLDRVAVGWAEILEVRHTGSASRATVAVTATTWTLARSASGVTATATITLADHPTLADLADAVEANAGWSATVLPGFGDWATADLDPAPGTHGALASSFGVGAYTCDLAVSPDFERGLIALGRDYPPGHRYPDRRHGGDPRVGTVLVRYTAGYDATTAPADLADAVIALARALHERPGALGAKKSETLGDYSYTLAELPADVASAARDLLWPYMDCGIA